MVDCSAHACTKPNVRLDVFAFCNLRHDVSNIEMSACFRVSKKHKFVVCFFV